MYGDDFFDARPEQIALIMEFLKHEKTPAYSTQKLISKKYKNTDGSITTNMCFREKDGHIYLVSNDLSTRLVKLEENSDIIDGNTFFADTPDKLIELSDTELSELSTNVIKFQKDGFDYKLLVYTRSRGTNLFIYLCTRQETINVKIFYFNHPFIGQGHEMDIADIKKILHRYKLSILNEESFIANYTIDISSLTENEKRYLLTF